MQQHPFFIYGTLLPGQPNDFYWGDSIARSQVAVIQQMALYALPHFPMMIETDHTDSHVIGRLIWLQPGRYATILNQLDQLEGYDPADSANSLYQRIQHSVKTAAGDTYTAWTYIGQPLLVKGLPLVPNGDWVTYIQAKS